MMAGIGRGSEDLTSVVDGKPAPMLTDQTKTFSGYGSTTKRVDVLSQAFWESQFKTQYLSLREDAFQEFFCQIMERRYPGDFQRVVAWGRIGDLKNDGYLTSRRQIFQCYGPKQLVASEALLKINSDYDGALKHWKTYFDRARGHVKVRGCGQPKSAPSTV